MKRIIKLILFICIPLFAQDITNKLGGASESETYDITDSADNVLVRVEGNGEVGIGTDGPDANLDVHGTVKIFGNYESSTEGPHQATTDGFVVCWILGSSAAAGIAGYTDTNPSPTTLIQYASCDNDGGAINIVMPVKKGNYWLLNTISHSGDLPTITWIPLGQ